VPRQHSSRGKDKLGSISKQGDRYLRSDAPWFIRSVCML
jgi:transposase